MANANETKRERASGRYAPRGFENVCMCGHTLGAHSSERVRFGGKLLQDCFADGCDCECYKRDRRAR